MKHAMCATLCVAILASVGCGSAQQEPAKKWAVLDDSAAPPVWLTVERQGDRVERIVIDLDEVLRTQRGAVSGGIIAEVTHEDGKVVIDFSEKP